MIVIDIPVPPPANNLFANGQKGRYRTRLYDAWIERAGWELRRQRPQKVTGAVSVLVEVEDSPAVQGDADGRLKAPLDLLVKHGVIESDRKKIVRETTARWNKDIRGARVTITPVEAA